MRPIGYIRRGTIVLAGYLVRCPLGGYAWQAAHYLVGLRDLGFDVWFYEDTGYYASAYDPVKRELGSSYEHGIRAAAAFFDGVGFADRWIFVDSERGEAHGPGAARADAIVREADLLINLGGVNEIVPERRSGRPAVYIDIDPGYTQLRLVNDGALRALLDQHEHLFSFGENIGTPRSPLPTGGYKWHPTRQPVVLRFWQDAGPPGVAYTTVGKWDIGDRDLEYRGQVFSWRKRSEWLRCIDLPARTGATFELAMDVDSVPGDLELLRTHRWRILDPIALSADCWRYRDYLRASRGEFTVAKDMNVRLRSGWFSDRAASYLAAGRPVIEQDTGFGDVLPLGPGLHSFCDVEEAAAAVRTIESDYDRASRHATEVARECFAAERVLGRLLSDAGF